MVWSIMMCDDVSSCVIITMSFHGLIVLLNLKVPRVLNNHRMQLGVFKDLFVKVTQRCCRRCRFGIVEHLTRRVEKPRTKLERRELPASPEQKCYRNITETKKLPSAQQAQSFCPPGSTFLKARNGNDRLYRLGNVLLKQRRICWLPSFEIHCLKDAGGSPVHLVSTESTGWTSCDIIRIYQWPIIYSNLPVAKRRDGLILNHKHTHISFDYHWSFVLMMSWWEGWGK